VPLEDANGDDAALEAGAEGGASGEAGHGEGGASDGAGADADADATACDTCVTGFCRQLSPQPILCTDFDEPGFDQGWTEVVPTPGRLAADAVEFRSPPIGLESTVLAGSASSDTYAYLSRSFGVSSATNLSYAFDLVLDQTASGPYALVAELNIDGTGHSLDLSISDSNGSIQEVVTTDAGPTIVQHPLSAIPVRGTWTRVQIDVNLSPTPNVSVKVGGATALASSALDPSWKPGSVSLVLGFAYITSSAATWQAHFDNVTYDAR
jgi:hypothetical protein